MNVLDLFSGIGGFSLGLERAGMRTVAFCEIEPYARAVLRKHWPDVPCYEDVRTLTADRLHADGVWVDVICGGFPCQDISLAGKGAGIEGERSGLWSEYARIIGEVRPLYVIVENVSALLGRGLDRVLGDLATLGYDAEWHCIPASAVGAPHRRDRLWLVAHPARIQPRWEEQWTERERTRSRSEPVPVADAEINGRFARRQGDAQEEQERRESDRGGIGSFLADAHRKPPGWLTEPWPQCDHWLVEPDVGRVANGVPSRVDRLKGLGNAVVPQIPEIIGRAIMRAKHEA